MTRFSISWASDGKPCWVVHDSENPSVRRVFRTLLDAENFITRESCPDEVESA